MDANFIGTVVIQHQKNNQTYLGLIPVGVPFEDASAAFIEMAEEILKFQKKQQEAAAAAQAEQDGAAPVESVDAELVSPEITE
jgi:hypothetical protein